MENYIGETVLVSLKDPPDTQVRGLVSGIVDLQLCLKDGMPLERLRHPRANWVLSDLAPIPASHGDLCCRWARKHLGS